MATVLAMALASLGVWYFDVPHAAVEEVATLHGQTDSAIFGKLGAPSYEHKFTMDEMLGEFQIELYNTYPPDSPNNPNVEIRECTWEYSRHRLTIWFHKPNGSWVVLDTCRYQNGVVF